MIASLILLYIILVYFFDMEREMVFKLLLIYSILSLLPMIAIILLYGVEGPTSMILPFLMGL